MPWTKLGFEPVVVTIHTMEIALSLNDGESQSDTNSVSSSQTGASASSSKRDAGKRVKTKRKVQNTDDPPGFMQSLLNRCVPITIR